MDIWAWIALGGSLLMAGIFLHATYRDLIKEASMRWYRDQPFSEVKPWYVIAHERRLERGQKGSHR